MLFERAIARAKELDSSLARTGRVMGPLHGLPISLKDQFCLVDVDSAIGR
jgi:amidase